MYLTFSVLKKDKIKRIAFELEKSKKKIINKTNLKFKKYYYLWVVSSDSFSRHSV